MIRGRSGLLVAAVLVAAVLVAAAGCGIPLDSGGKSKAKTPAVIASVFPAANSVNVNPQDLISSVTGVRVNFTVDIDTFSATTLTMWIAQASTPDVPISGQYTGATGLRQAFLTLTNPGQSTQYAVTITTGVRRAGSTASVLNVNYRWFFTTGVTPTVTITWNPTGSGVGTSQTSLTAQFAGSTMNGSSITNQTFLLHTLTALNGSTVQQITTGTTISFSNNVATMTLPASTLQTNTAYRMTIKASVTQSNGNAPFATDQTNDFSTGTNTVTYVASVSPTANNTSVVASTTAVSMTFNVAMTATTFTAASFTISPAVATGAPTYDAVSKTATLPVANLQGGTQYTAILTSAVKDANNATAFPSGYTWSFTTSNTSPPPTGTIVINEILYDPGTATSNPAGVDANGDGATDSTDEFVELVNNGTGSIDISGYEIWDATAKQYKIPNGTPALAAGKAIVIFGAWTSTNQPTTIGGSPVLFRGQTTTLNLNNSGDTVTVKDSTGTVVATFPYGTGTAIGVKESITRDPDVTGTDFKSHRQTAGGAALQASPGTKANGTSF